MASTLLLIDDDDLSREILTLLLEEDGYGVTAFASGDLALAYLAERDGAPKPAVVLTDLQMPGVSGAALAGALRRQVGEALPIVAMSGSPAREAELAGYDGFLLKPLTASDLRELLERVQRAAGRIDRERPEPTHTGSAAQTPVLDEKTFADMALLLRPEQMRDLLALCFSEIARYTQRMVEAQQNGEEAALRAAAHAVKGSVAMLGARELQALAADLEAGTGDAAYQAATLGEIAPAAERLRRMLLSRGFRFGDQPADAAHEDTIA